MILLDQVDLLYQSAAHTTGEQQPQGEGQFQGKRLPQGERLPQGVATTSGKGQSQGLGGAAQHASGVANTEEAADTGLSRHTDGPLLHTNGPLPHTDRPLPSSLVLMCYEGGHDPLRLILHVRTTWTDLSRRLQLVFGSPVRLHSLLPALHAESVGDGGGMWQLAAKDEGGMRELVVEDEGSLRELLSRSLNQFGTGASNGVVHVVVAAVEGATRERVHETHGQGPRVAECGARIQRPTPQATKTANYTSPLWPPKSDCTQSTTHPMAATSRPLHAWSTTACPRSQVAGHVQSDGAQGGQRHGDQGGGGVGGRRLQAIHTAARRGDVNVIRAWLQPDSGSSEQAKESVVWALDAAGATPMHYAASAGQAETIRLLLQHDTVRSAHARSAHARSAHAASAGQAETTRPISSSITPLCFILRL